MRLASARRAGVEADRNSRLPPAGTDTAPPTASGTRNLHQPAHRRALLLGTAILVTATGVEVAPLRAQTAAEPLVLDTIVLTARKRTEDEATLPISTTVVTPLQFPASSLDSANAVARAAPGTNFVDFARFGEGYLTMRGVATLGTALNPLDSTVGFSVDGVPSSLSGLNAPLLDVERVEVLRGPQGTTFGRNALGGSIDVVSRTADGERDYGLDTEIGSDGHAYAQATVGGWVVPDKVAGRAVLRFSGFDGDIENPVRGESDGGARLGAGRGTLRFTPDDTLTIDVTGAYSSSERNDPSNILADSSGFPVSGADYEPFNRQKLGYGTVKVEKDLGSVILTSVTSYQDVRLKADNDYSDAFFFSALTGQPASFFNAEGRDYYRSDEHERTFVQELRVNSAEGSAVQWVVGGNYFRSRYDYRREMENPVIGALNPGVGALTNGTVDNLITSTTVGIFGDATVDLGPNWTASGGLRLAHDKQSLEGRYTGNGFPGIVARFAQDDTVSDSYAVGRLALSYSWADEAMAYASIARGYASGGFEKSTNFAPLGVTTPAFSPSTSWTHELGTKVRLNDRLRLNASLFYNDVADGQLATFGPRTFALYYASEDYRSHGIDVSLTAEPIDGLELSGGFSAVKSRLVGVSAGSASTGVRDGNEVPQVPSFSANLSASYRTPLADLPGEVVVSGSYAFVGERYSDIANTGLLDEYHTVDLRVGWEDGATSIYAFANNLLDERPVHYSVPVAPGVASAYVGRGRVVGIGAGVKF